MLDIHFIRNNLEAVRQNIQQRCLKVSLDDLIDLDKQRRSLIGSLEKLLSKRNENANRMKSSLSSEERSHMREEGRRLKEEIAFHESKIRKVELNYHEILLQIPNMQHPQAPIGSDESSNREIVKKGFIREFDFSPKDHVEIAEALDIVDFKRASEVTGSKFYYLKNQGVILDLALQRYALDLLNKEGFSLYLTPDLAQSSIVESIGFNPRGEESNIYTLANTDLCLIGTSEITLGGYYKGQNVDLSEKNPILMAGLSHCFRKEAGAAGQFSKGLYRVHQFTKVEMFAICRQEQSEECHERFLRIEEKIFQNLGLPYRVLDICSQDLGASAYRKFDIEAWMPGRGDYGEVTSTSNCTDYQARRLQVRYKDDQGKWQFVHMVNGTAIATSRAIVAILENGQQEDGSVEIPKALIPYTGFSIIKNTHK